MSKASKKQRAPNEEEMLAEFTYHDLARSLRPIGYKFWYLANELYQAVPPGINRAYALHWLLRARNCALQALEVVGQRRE